MTSKEHGVRAAYDDVADLYAEHFRATEAEQPVDVAMIEHFVSLLTSADGARPRVLDACCGAGRMLPLLARFGADVEGVDLSPAMIRRAHRDHAQFTTRVGTLTALPHDTASFDGAFSWYSTIHNPDNDLPTMLAELARVTRAGGCVLVAFQAGEGERDASGAYRERGHDIVLTRYLRTPDDMSAALEEVGLEVIARLERPAVGGEREPQAVVIARRT
ncbi:methyltransferase domain-containing protein [Dermacoccus abyssi]|uniref:class I SAM-dependent DNA methyltransferase n=1 Tax=Dermacoccus abyssi TaxID=322596 RepID=UPI0021A4CA7C|nr:methyltransferase domain-containing protein [Dermacoccus abyssi]